jgi:hypothetical protein
MKKTRYADMAAFIFAAALLFPKSAFACEPVIPLIMLFGAPFYSLFGIVFLKAIGFAWLERSIPALKSILFVVVANIASSLIGFVLILGASVPTSMLFFLPVIYLISLRPAGRLIDFLQIENPSALNKQGVAATIVILYFMTFILFGAAQLQIDSSLTAYWILKYLYVLTALVISIGLTTLWEELIIAGLSKSKKNYLINVLKVNLVAFLLIMAFLAAVAMPKRLKSNNFLIQNITTIHVGNMS